MDHPLIDPAVLMDTRAMPSITTPATATGPAHVPPVSAPPPSEKPQPPPEQPQPPTEKPQPPENPEQKKPLPKKTPKKEKDENRATPHIWTTGQRSTLLELIAKQNLLGQATDNGGMKKEAWTLVIQKLNDKHGLNLILDQVKNQKNFFQKLYFDYKFLLLQRGFGWDDEKGLPTADKSVWDELIEAHPCCEVAKLKDKPFPLYDLAASVWDRTAATGDFAELAIPPTATNSIKPSTKSIKMATKPIKLTPAEKRKLISANNDDTDINVEPLASVQTNKSTNTTTPTKQVQENKNQIIKTEMDGVNSAMNTVMEMSKELMGAFSKISTAMLSNNSK